MPGLSLIAVSEGYTLVAVCGLLIVMASLDAWALVAVVHTGLVVLRHVKSGSRTEPASPAPAGTFFTTEPPGNP